MGKNKKTKKCLPKLALQDSPTKQLKTWTQRNMTTFSAANGPKSTLSHNNIDKTDNNLSCDAESNEYAVGADAYLDMNSIDHSVVGEPINLGVKNVRQILACIKDGTSEVKDVILNECSIIYECKICLNLFRSLASFITHKRVFCKEHSCEKMILFDSTVLQFKEEEEEAVEDLSPAEDEDVEEQTDSGNATSTDFCSPLSTSSSTPTTTILNKSVGNKRKRSISQKRKFIEECVAKVEREKKIKEEANILELKLSPIKLNPNAVYQKLSKHESDCHQNEENTIVAAVDKDNNQVVCEDNTSGKSNISELAEKEPVNNMQTTKNGPNEENVLLPNSQSSDPDLIDENEASMSFKCDICQSSFTSAKTLKVHMRTIHSHNRLIYPCPLCSLTFKQLSNATRHIIQIHKRTRTQATTLREVMRRRAYSANSSENSSELEDASDASDDSTEQNDSMEQNEKTDQKKDIVNNEKLMGKKEVNPEENKCSFSKINVIENGSSKLSCDFAKNNTPRINAACIYNCGSRFDWAPAKKSHEKSCQKRTVMPSSKPEPQPVAKSSTSTESSSSTSSPLTPSSLKCSSQVETEICTKSDTISPVSAHNSIATNITLPRRVEEQIKNFTDTKSLRCTFCPTQAFMNLNQLLHHAVTHVGYHVYRCHGCSFHTIVETDMKNHLMNNHNIGEDMISKHYQTISTPKQPRLFVVPVKARKSINGPSSASNALSVNGLQQIKPVSQNQDKNRSKFLKIHLRPMGNKSKKCYQIVDK